ncbi:MAG: hypothetical protein ACRDQ4_22690 [Pseudonocardiaceae bacterium]
MTGAAAGSKLGEVATTSNGSDRRAAIHLTFLGKESQPDESPTLFATDRDSYLVQGWIVTDPEILARIAVSDDETIVEVPAALMAHLAQDGLSGDVVNVVPPIVHITENGNYIIKGSRVTDPETLEQMTIPDHETCVEVSRSAIAALVGD